MSGDFDVGRTTSSFFEQHPAVRMPPRGTSNRAIACVVIGVLGVLLSTPSTVAPAGMDVRAVVPLASKFKVAAPTADENVGGCGTVQPTQHVANSWAR